MSTPTLAEDPECKDIQRLTDICTINLKKGSRKWYITCAGKHLLDLEKVPLNCCNLSKIRNRPAELKRHQALYEALQDQFDYLAAHEEHEVTEDELDAADQARSPNLEVITSYENFLDQCQTFHQVTDLTSRLTAYLAMDDVVGHTSQL